MSRDRFCFDCQHDRGKANVPAVAMRNFWVVRGETESRFVCGEHEATDKAFHAHMESYRGRARR